jgi:hypothetical protein
MADNVAVTPGVGANVAADDVGGVLVQRVKPQHGVDGAAVDTSATNPLPVTDAAGATQTTLAAVLAKLSADPATQATAAAILAKLSADPATQTTLAAVLAAVDGLEANTTGLATQTTLAALLADSQAKADLNEAQPVSDNGGSLTVDGTVALDSPSLAALETTELGATTLAALETISLDSATLAALESITIGTALPAGTNALGTVGVTSQPSASSATVTQVTSSATSVTLKASNASRKGLSVFNDSTAVLYLKFGATASATSFTVKIGAGEYWESPAAPVYTGVVDGIWASANGFAYVTEI